MQVNTYYHQSFLGNHFSQGYYGVDLFFVISGFIITHSSVNLLGDRSAFFTYWHKRFIRVYPMYWLILLPVVAGTAFIGSARQPSFVLFMSSATQWTATLFLLPDHLEINGVSWTLSHELYFYLLFSLLILSARLWFIPVGVVAGTLIYMLAGPTHTGGFPMADFFLSPFTIEFGLGALIWSILNRYSLPLRVSWLLAGVAVGGLVAFQSIVTNEDHTHRVLVFGCSSFLFLLALAGLDVKGRLYVPAWLIRIGDASYVLYLLHLPVLIFANKLLILMPQPFISASVLNGVFAVLVVPFSVYIHTHVEKPLLNSLRWRSGAAGKLVLQPEPVTQQK